MNRIHLATAALAVLGLGLSDARAATAEFAGGAGGDFASPAVWKDATPPADGDTASVIATDDAEVAFTLSSDYATELARLCLGTCAEDGHVSLDTKGFDFAPKTSTVGSYADANGALSLIGPQGYGYLQVSSPTDANHAPYAFRDARLDLYRLADGSGLVDFSRGEFDFGLDSGETMTFGLYEPSAEYRFSGTSQLKVGTVKTLFDGRLAAGGKSNDMKYKLAFVGGTHTIDHFIYANSDRTWPEGHLVVLSNATLSVKQFEMAPKGIGTFVTGPGGVLNIGASGFGVTNSAGSESRLIIDRGTWNLNPSGNTVRFGGSGPMSLVANGATINQTSGRVLFYDNKVFAFTNTVWNATASGPYISLSYGPSVNYVGGALNVRNLMVGQNGSAAFTIDGGTHQIDYLSFVNGTTEQSTFTVKGGASVKVTNGIGYTNGEQLYASVSRAVVTIEGADTYLETPKILIAKKNSNPEDTSDQNRVTIDAAHVKVSTQIDVASGSARRGILRLTNGALLEVKQITSSSGLSTAGGLGELEVDGGTIRAITTQDGDAAGLISYQDTVSVGDGGLTVDTAGYDVRLRFCHRITNKSGERGVLTKVGEGAAKFYMNASTYGVYTTAYDVDETRVLGGTLLVADATTTLSTDLYVGNGATFSMQGSAQQLTLDGLAVTNGTLLLDASDVISVGGKVSFKQLQVSLTTAPTAGGDPITLLKVDGEMDEASKAEWSDALMTSSVAEGYHASFTTVYDSETGKTHLQVAVVENTPMTETTTWIGADGDWSKPANWSNGCPAYDTIAQFADNGATKTVTVSASARAGALDFACGGFTLQGGTVTLKATGENARIRADGGETLIRSTIAPNSDFTANVTASDATLDLAGTVEFSGPYGFRKTGVGTLALGGTNVITGGVWMDEGLTDVRSTTNAFGAARTTTKLYLAAAGRLKLHGGEVAIPMEIVGASDARQLVFAEGTTNTLLEVRIPSKEVLFTVEEDAEMTCHDWRGFGTSYKHGAGHVVLDGTVWLSEFAAEEGSLTIAASTYARPAGGLDQTDGVKTSFRVGGYARVDCDTLLETYNALKFTGKSGVFDLNGHDVRFGAIYAADSATFGRITSAAPALFGYGWGGYCPDISLVDIGGEVTFVYDARPSTTYPHKALSLDTAMSTRGGLVVTNGYLTMTANASWRNPTGGTVFVGGPNDGRLIVNKSDTFSKKMNFDLREQGVLELVGGIRQRCADLYLDGSATPAALGTWGATGSGAEHIDDTHFAGTGKLVVRGSKRRGVILILR